VADACIAGNHHILAHILLEGLDGPLEPLAQHNIFLAVRDPRRHPNDYRRVKPFADFKCLLDKGQRFRRTGWLKDRQFGVNPHPAGILLVLRGMHLRVVANHNNKAGIDSDVGRGHQRVHRHIQPDMFAGSQRPHAPHRGAVSRFIGRLFIDGPLNIHFRKQGQRFENLCRWRTRVSTGHFQTGLPGPSGQGFIA